MLGGIASLLMQRHEDLSRSYRASINVTGGALIDDIIIIMHDYVAGADRARPRHQVADFGDILPPVGRRNAWTGPSSDSSIAPWSFW